MRGNNQDNTVWKAVLLLQAISSELVYQAQHKETVFHFFQYFISIFTQMLFSTAIHPANIPLFSFPFLSFW